MVCCWGDVMADGSDAKAAWVRRVLGVDPSGGGLPPGSTFGARWQAAWRAWEEATGEVSRQIGILADTLRASGDQTLRDIAEYGLNGVTGNHLVRLRAAGIEIGRAAGTPPGALLDSTEALVEDFADHLRKDRRVALTEANPFHVPVPIQARLVPALDALASTLART